MDCFLFFFARQVGSSTQVGAVGDAVGAGVGGGPQETEKVAEEAASPKADVSSVKEEARLSQTGWMTETSLVSGSRYVRYW